MKYQTISLALMLLLSSSSDTSEAINVYRKTRGDPTVENAGTVTQQQEEKKEDVKQGFLSDHVPPEEFHHDDHQGHEEEIETHVKKADPIREISLKDVVTKATEEKNIVTTTENNDGSFAKKIVEVAHKEEKEVAKNEDELREEIEKKRGLKLKNDQNGVKRTNAKRVDIDAETKNDHDPIEVIKKVEEETGVKSELQKKKELQERQFKPYEAEKKSGEHRILEIPEIAEMAEEKAQRSTKEAEKKVEQTKKELQNAEHDVAVKKQEEVKEKEHEGQSSKADVKVQKKAEVAHGKKTE